MKLLYKIPLVPLILAAVSIAAFSQSATNEYFSSAESGFKIKLAKTPTSTENRSSNFGSGTLYIWEDSKSQFVIQSILFPSPVDEKFKAEFLLGFKDGLFTSSKATSITDKDYSFKGNKGAEFTLRYETKAKTIARGFYVGLRFFSVTGTFLLDHPGVKESDIVATMNSFDVVESTPAAAKTAVK